MKPALAQGIGRRVLGEWDALGFSPGHSATQEPPGSSRGRLRCAGRCYQWGFCLGLDYGRERGPGFSQPDSRPSCSRRASSSSRTRASAASARCSAAARASCSATLAARSATRASASSSWVSR